MVMRHDLGGVWRLGWSEDGPEFLAGAEAPGQVLIDARTPGTVHEALLESGLIEEPNYGLNSLKCRWVEEQLWVYRTEFEASADMLVGAQWLVFEWLETVAVVILNDCEVGRHCNSHRSARFDVTGKLRTGANSLVVMVEAGLHEKADAPVSAYAFDRYATITKRPLLRRPQYQSGWDWNPRLMNVGIPGPVRLECADVPLLASCWVAAEPSDDYAAASFTVCAEVLYPGGAAPATLRAGIPACRLHASVEAPPPSDASMASVARLTLQVDKPELWWPIGHGRQFLYDVDIALDTGGTSQTASLRTGVRRVTIDQSPHPVEGRHFIVCVNDRPIFCKGGNWVPPDVIPSRVEAGRYRELVRHAVEANFNTLRVWGGAVFAPPSLLDACDEAGVMVWHDFLFACARYPGDDPAFVAEVRAEVTEAVRRMARHPSLAVWCGNNEVEWGDREWGYAARRPAAPHHDLFHYHIPAIIAAEDPSKPYWPSSPWSPGFASPNDPTVGDQHPWGVSILSEGPADFWKYRDYVDRFPNEGGVIGCSLPSTLRSCMPEADQRLLSPSWVHHDNPIAYRGSRPGDLGRAYDTVRLWTGLDPVALSLDDYALISGLIQAEGLQEYITNYRRRMFSSASAIFWMYNDSWPATHGWTIVDYYLRRKLCYHPVRRAFAPITVVVADEGDKIAWYGINDTPEAWRGTLRYGIFRLAGGVDPDRTVEAELPASASVRLAEIDGSALSGDATRRCGAFGVLSGVGCPVAQHRLFRARFGELEFAHASVAVERIDADHIALSSGAFAWGVCLDLSGSSKPIDNCFDLLPGVRYTVPWRGGDELPEDVVIGSVELRRLVEARQSVTQP